MSKQWIFMIIGLSGLSILFLSTPGSPAQSAGSLRPVGSFVKIEGYDGVHANGHRVMLWRNGGTLIGQLTYWESNIEGQSGDFVDGSINSKTGDIKFRVTVERRDVAPNEYSTALFAGRLKGNVIEGSLKWEGEASRWRGKNGVERLKLPKDNQVNLLLFNDVAAWQAAPYNREDVK